MLVITSGHMTVFIQARVTMELQKLCISLDVKKDFLLKKKKTLFKNRFDREVFMVKTAGWKRQRITSASSSTAKKWLVAPGNHGRVTCCGTT